MAAVAGLVVQLFWSARAEGAGPSTYVIDRRAPIVYLRWNFVGRSAEM
jgi:hypothetical protein